MKKIIEEDREYSNNPFWTNKGDKLTVVGDYLGRLPAIKLLNPSEGEIILDAGCGAGFCTRRIARIGINKFGYQRAIVFGCDRNKNMLNQAIRHEEEDPLGINYQWSEISNMPYEQGMFDRIACIAVLIHNSPEDCKKFFSEASRVLKPNGRIVISIMHPALYQEGSPNRTNRASWARYKPLENKSMLESQRFEEVYKNSLGDTFTSIVWYHPEGSLQALLKEVGFSVLVTQSVSVNSDILRKCNQTGEVNYPGFQQILAKKIN